MPSIDLMRPAVQADGGDLVLVPPTRRPAWSKSSCRGRAAPAPSAPRPSRGAWSASFDDRLPWVTEVQGGVDDSLDPFESESMGRGGYVPSY